MASCGGAKTALHNLCTTPSSSGTSWRVAFMSKAASIVGAAPVMIDGCWTKVRESASGISSNFTPIARKLWNKCPYRQ